METTNEKLRSLVIRHAVHLLRYGNGVEADIVKLLSSADKAIAEKLAARLALIEERGLDIGPATTARLQALLEEVRELNSAVYQKAEQHLTGELVELAKNEGSFQANALTNVVAIDFASKTPAPALLKAIVTELPIKGVLLSKTFANASQKRLDTISQTIQQGMFEGKGADAIVRKLIGTKGQNYADGDFRTARSDAARIVRTSISHVSNVAAQETWKANADIISGWQFVATLDNRTSIECGSLDGQVFPVGQGPIPPVHPNCRSISVAVTKSFNQLGLDRDDYSPDTRASMDGQITAPTNFAGWLKNQSEARQNDVLGPTRAEAFRSGKLKMEDFIRNKTEVIPIDELKKLHPDSFRD